MTTGSRPRLKNATTAHGEGKRNAPGTQTDQEGSSATLLPLRRRGRNAGGANRPGGQERFAAVELERAPGPFTGQEGSTATLLQLRLRRGRAPETFTDRRGL
ncbi:hypothetical protein [Sodalis sp. (in: enterobacteria)]|uniref:hypothetical protein n=1 Tax=Sodalis sp. (in: enterobacteria) TaxID=1898979 RepID=UPI003F3C4AAE